jgi:antiviral helicase SKI2
MDVEKQAELINKILHPDPRNSQQLLKELGLAGLPSRAEVHQEIEKKLLLPREKLPPHWLPKYQVYDVSCSGKTRSNPYQ